MMIIRSLVVLYFGVDDGSFMASGVLWTELCNCAQLTQSCIPAWSLTAPTYFLSLGHKGIVLL